MAPEERLRVNEIFERAREIDPEERGEFLDRECAGNDAQRREVEALLAAHEKAGAWMPTPMDSHGLEPDFVIKDRYQIISELGCGGFGCVYLAWQTRLKKKVAIKVLHRQVSSRPDLLRAFRQEAENASSLDDPKIVTIHDIDEDNGLHFIVMEFVDGETLRQSMKAGPLELKKVREIGAQIAHALQVTHKAGIVHQDIKPENIMLRRADGGVKVLDFGIARLAPASVSTAARQTFFERETQPDLWRAAGTPPYVSPERWERPNEVDGRADIFSLGVTLFEMITGHLPFRGWTRDEWRDAICTKEPERITRRHERVPVRLQRIVLKALAKERDDRYQSAGEIRDDLEKLDRGPRWFRVAAILLPLIVLSTIISRICGGPGPPPRLPRFRELVSRDISDGGRIVFASFSPESKQIAYSTSGYDASHLWIVDAGGGQSMKITDGKSDRNPIWSMDRDHPQLSFLSDRNGLKGIWQMPVPGFSPTLLHQLNRPSTRLIGWCTQRGTIYYEVQPNLFRFDSATGTASQVTDFPRDSSAREFSVSADERYIAYVETKEGKARILVKPINGGEPRMVIGGEGDDRSPSWFPDGKRFAFISRRGGVYQVFIGFVDGREPRLISTDQNNYDFVTVSLDGTKMIATSSVQNASIFSTDIQSEEEKELVTDLGIHLYPTASTHTGEIVFQSLSSEMKLDSSIFRKSTVTPDPKTLVLSNGFDARWSRDGRELAFLRRAERGFSLIKIGASGGREQILTRDGVRVSGETGAPYYRPANNYDWSHDGTRMAYSSARSGSLNIWVVSTDGLTDKVVTDNGDPGLKIESPSWSPDDRQIAYLESPLGSSTGIRRVCVIELRTGNKTIACQRTWPLRLLGWSGSGHDLLVAEGEQKPPSPPQRVKLFRVPLLGGREEQISDPFSEAYFHSLTLSADRRFVAFASRQQARDNLFVVPISGGDPRKVTRNTDGTFYYSGVSWSPDGRRLYYSKQRGWGVIWIIEDF